MDEFDITLSEKMLVDLLLGKASVKVEFDGLFGKFSLNSLSAVNVDVSIATHNQVKRTFKLYCLATRGVKDYRVRLTVSSVNNENWYKGKIVFVQAP